jgi:hypothetical protein
MSRALCLNMSHHTFTVQGALRADQETGNPPLNMHRAIVFNGILVFAISLLVFFLRGRQVRRELDEQMNVQQLSHVPLEVDPLTAS